MADISPESLIKSEWSHYYIFGCSVFGIAWGVFNSLQVSKVELKVENIKAGEEDNSSIQADLLEELKMPSTPEACKAKMEEINIYIKDGATSFLK